METFISDLSKKEFPKSEKISGHTIRPSVLEVIRKGYPDFGATQNCSLTELNVYRQRYIGEYLVNEVGELSELEDTVLNSLKTEIPLLTKLKKLTHRQLLASA